MDKGEQIAIEALLFREIDHEVDRVWAQQVYSRAKGLLDRASTESRQGVNCTSDDDPILHVKQMIIDYKTVQGSCILILSNFHRNRCSDTVSNQHVQMELCEGGLTQDQIRYAKKELLFSMSDGGDIESPLGLVEASISDSLISLFEEQERQLYSM